MHCGIIKADHPQFVNHADGGVKWSVHTWQSGALASAAPFFFFSVRFRSAILVSDGAGVLHSLGGADHLMWSH